MQELNPWKKDKGIVGLVSKFAIAQTTAIIAGFISYPFDTVRRRLQMQAEKVSRTAPWTLLRIIRCYAMLRDGMSSRIRSTLFLMNTAERAMALQWHAGLRRQDYQG